jgi:hypothetical protein
MDECNMNAATCKHVDAGKATNCRSEKLKGFVPHASRSLGYDQAALNCAAIVGRKDFSPE